MQTATAISFAHPCNNWLKRPHHRRAFSTFFHHNPKNDWISHRDVTCYAFETNAPTQKQLHEMRVVLKVGRDRDVLENSVRLRAGSEESYEMVYRLTPVASKCRSSSGLEEWDGIEKELIGTQADAILSAYNKKLG